MKRIVAAVISVVLAMLCGCGRSGYPVEAYGAEITQAPARIASLSPNIDDILSALGCDGLLVGVCDSSPFSGRDGTECLGTAENPDIDRIISVSPDIVFTSIEMDSEDAERLDIRDIKIVVIPSANTVEALEQIYRNIGSCINGSIVGDKNGKTAYKALEAAISPSKAAGQSVVCLLSKEFDVATGDCFVSSFLTELGFTNCAASAKDFTFSKAEIASADPDMIICIKGMKDAVINDSELSGCTAVKNGDVYEIEEDILTRQGRGLIDAASKLYSFAE
ncbi:MAG: ABC transporter substrate-binding protein [Acutalibacteraceae bacterium]